MIKRIISAIVLIPLVVLSILYAPFWFLKLLVLAAGVISYIEWSSFNPVGKRFFYIFLSIVFLSSVLFLSNEYTFIILMIIFLVHMLIGFKRINRQEILAQYYLFGGILYVSFYVFFINIIQLNDGRLLFLILCASIWVGDSFAYFCGKSFGKIKLAKTISPKKTYEGAVCGVIFGTLFSLVFGYFIHIDLNRAFFIGFAANIAGIFGDLAESVIKRIYDKKDSSNIIPGHGGMLDRLDSLAFSTFIVYLMLIWKIF